MVRTHRNVDHVGHRLRIERGTPIHAVTILAGVDAGGSYTEAAITDPSMGRVFRHRDRPSCLVEGRIADAALIIEQTVRGALSRSGSPHIDLLVIGAAGAGNPALQDELRSALSKTKIARAIHITTDAQLQLEAAFPTGEGIMVSAGTGSIALARDRNGIFHRAGGHGFRFGDEGSGYAIGRNAVQAALQAGDGRGSDTILVDLLRLETGTNDQKAFVLWTRDTTRPNVADLSSVVMLACQAGDNTARQIIEAAAEELVAHVLALTPYLATKGATRIAMAGGLLDHDTPLRTHTVSRLITVIPNLDLSPSSIDAISGALHMARRLTAHASD